MRPTRNPGLCGRRRVGLAACHHHPGDARRLVGQRHGGEFGRLALQQLRGPASAGVVLAGKTHDGRRADHQQPSDIAVALLAGPALPLFAAAAVRFWRQAEPSGELSAGSEERPVGVRGGDRAGGDRSDARDGGQAPTDNVGAVPRHDPRLQPFDGGREVAELIDDSVKRQSRGLWQLLLGLVQRFEDSLHAAWSLCSNDAEFREVSAQPVDEHRSLPNKQIARPVQHQGGLLVHRLDGHEAHGRWGDGLANHLGVGRVSLATLHIRIDRGWRHQLHRMPQGRYRSGPVMRRSARLYADKARCRRLEKFQHIGPAQLSPRQYSPICINPVNLENILIPALSDQNPCAQSRSRTGMIRQGRASSLFQVSQQ